MKQSSIPRSIEFRAIQILNKLQTLHKCSGCGSCCRELDSVDLDMEDISLIASGLEMSEESFIEEHLVPDGKGCWSFRLKPECPFLSKKNRCTIYQFRPKVCKNFPFKAPYLIHDMSMALMHDELYPDKQPALVTFECEPPCSGLDILHKHYLRIRVEDKISTSMAHADSVFESIRIMKK